MEKKQHFFALLLLFTMVTASSQAQQNIPASGGEASGSEGTTSYSVGQLVYQCKIGSNGSVSEGVQQPYEISVISTTPEVKEINISFSAYPNPTDDILILEISEDGLTDLSYMVLDIKGKLLKHEQIRHARTEIHVSNLLPATYFLKVIQKNTEEMKTFKIIKY
jgi:hypothetical protein